MLTLLSPAQKKEIKKGGSGGQGGVEEEEEEEGEARSFKKVSLTHSFEAFLPLPDRFPEKEAGTTQIVLQ